MPDPVALAVDADALRALVKQVVAETIAELEQARQQVPDAKLAYSEGEAAALIGLQPWQLRDERLRGRITASKVAGRRVRYTPEALRRYLSERAQQQ